MFSQAVNNWRPEIMLGSSGDTSAGVTYLALGSSPCALLDSYLSWVKQTKVNRTINSAVGRR